MTLSVATPKRGVEKLIRNKSNPGKESSRVGEADPAMRGNILVPSRSILDHRGRVGRGPPAMTLSVSTPKRGVEKLIRNKSNPGKESSRVGEADPAMRGNSLVPSHSILEHRGRIGRGPPGHDFVRRHSQARRGETNPE